MELYDTKEVTIKSIKLIYENFVAGRYNLCEVWVLLDGR